MRRTWFAGAAAPAAVFGLMALLVAGENGAGAVEGAPVAVAPGPVRMLGPVPAGGKPGFGAAAAQIFGTCSYSVSPTSETVEYDATSGSVDVSWDWDPDPEFPHLGNQSQCGFWSSSSSDDWLSVSRSNSTTLAYSMSANDGAERSATVTVEDATFALTQEKAPCPLAPGGPPSSMTFGSGAGSQNLNLDEREDCPYAVSDDRSWITVSPSPVAGNGTVTVRVDANSGGERSGTVTIGTASIAVTQCPTGPAGLPPELTFESGGGVQSFTVGGSSSCSFAVSADSWIGVSPSQVSGGGSVRVEVPANTGTTEQSGTVSIGATSVTVTVDPSCPTGPSVSTSSLSFPSGSGSSQVSVVGSSTCHYDVSADREWITVSPAQVAGGGTVTVTVGGQPGQSGTVSIGATTVSVSIPCPSSPGVNPRSLSFESNGGSGAVRVSGSPHCSYSVSDNRGWIGPRSSSVVGGGSVTVDVDPNTGTQSRSGTVTIGGTTVPVDQKAPDDPEPPEPRCPSNPAVRPSSLSLGRGANQSGQVDVQEAATCSYTVTETLAWLRVEPASVAGNGTVTFTTETANDAASARPGTVMIGGTSVSVTQAGAGEPTNRPPVAEADTATTSPGTPVIIAVLANDTDPDGNSLQVAAVVTAPAHGTAAVGADLQTVVYSPGPTRTGDDSFTYRVSDGAGGTDVGTVTVTVQPSTSTNRPPTADAGPDQTVAQGVTVTLDGTGSSDADDDVLTYYWHQDAGPAVTFDNRAVASPTFTAPVVPGDRRLVFRLVVSDLGGPDVSEDKVTVTVIDMALIGHRDRLLADYATRKLISNACQAWDSLPETAQEVFIWNTHRLHRSGMLPDVTALYAVYGKDGTKCHGGDHNRTYMAMTPALQSRLNATEVGLHFHYPAWEESSDLYCVTGLGDCPHSPFTTQVETHGGHPRAQINFFRPNDSGILPRVRGPYSNPIRIDSYLMFEMDQDYNRFELPNLLDGIHASAPSCTGFDSGGRPMRDLYAGNYGDPTWDWEPSSCQPVGSVTVSGPDQQTVGPATGTFSATVTAPAASTWTAHSNVPWITILETTSDSSTGNGARSSRSRSAVETDVQEVRYEVAANSGTERTGTLRIAGKLVRIRQAGVRFNDDPIVAGSTPVRAIHILELRTRIDILRRREGLAAFPWTDNALVPEVTPIVAAHLSDLRTALQAAYEAAEWTVPSYTDPAIAPGAVAIRAVHLTELRAAVVALEQAVP